MSRLLLALVLAPLGCTFQVDEPLSRTDRPTRDTSLPFADAIRDDATDEPDTETPDDPGEQPTNPIGEPSEPDEPAAQPWDSSRRFVDAQGERFSGSLGVMNDFDLPADLAFVYDDGVYTTVEVYALRSDGERVMISLDAYGDGSTSFFTPGLGYRFKPGYARGFFTGGLGCQGPDSGVQSQGMAFADTPTDEEPCDTAVETEQDPNNPGVLLVKIAATLGDDCNEGEDPSGDGDDLPDGDGDGDGDIPPPPPPGNDPGQNDNHPLTVTASFALIQG